MTKFLSKYLSRSLLFAGAALSTQQALAGIGVSLMQSADVVRQGAFIGKAQGDIILNHGGGFNVSAHAATGVIDRVMDVDAFVGTGTTDFQAGGIVKFNFLPDIPGQIGVSFLAGGSYIFDQVSGSANQSSILVTTTALISKGFDTEFGRAEPYGAFQLEPFINGTNSNIALSLIAGSKWSPSAVSPWFFFTEFGFDLKDSFYSMNFGVGYPF